MAPQNDEQTDLIHNLEQYPDRIHELLADKTLLITGGTGFLGKVLIEKLLRSCYNLKTIYILIRTKKDKDPQERIREIFKGPLFERVRNERGDQIFNKVKAVPADLLSDDLSLSNQDRAKLIAETEIIFHVAATIRFDQDLQTAVFLNVRGTKLMLELAKECKKLLCFNHVSTAYCHLHERILYEKAYPPPADPIKVIKTCEWMDKETINTITPKILGDIPNTYAFTKALGEGLVNNEIDNLPVVIVRPSVVIPIWKEPLPGWTDNINGPTGLLIGAGKGVIRTMYCDPDAYSDYVPVDVVANAMICSVYDFITTKKRRFFNLTSSAEYKVSFDDIINIGRKVVSNRMPLNWVLWYPGGKMRKNRVTHCLAFFFYQLLPALLIDGILTVCNVKFSLVKVQKRIWKGYEVLEYYANRQWDFNQDMSSEARKLFNPRERHTYRIDGADVDYYEYFTDCTHAARLYILGERDDQIATAKLHMAFMWWVDVISKSLIVGAFFYFVVWKMVISPYII